MNTNFRILSSFIALLLAGQASAAGDLEIFFIDVQGGAATLVVTPERESVLIDTGWPGLEDRDPKRIVHVLKDVAGLDHIDHLVTTHWHTDHYGGVGGLAKLVPIHNFWDRGLPNDQDPSLDFPDGPKDSDPLLVAYLAASEGKRKRLGPGLRLPLAGQVAAIAVVGSGYEVPALEVDNPLADAGPPEQKPVDESDNARSLGLIFSLGQFQFLDLGDLTWNIERKLAFPYDRIRGAAKMKPEESVDLYQVTHHGMDTSNNPFLVKTIRPTVTIMNNGPRKGGAASVVKLLRSIPSIEANYQLHRNVATSADDNVEPDYIANKDEAGGQFVRVIVKPDGSSYSVRFGADGPAREFKSK
jgi:competence protein ComEC